MTNYHRELSVFRYRMRSRISRVRRAIRYALGRATTEDGWQLFRDAEDVTGFYCLEGIGVDDVLTDAIERYGDMPELPELARRACRRVYDKWNSTGDTQSAAEDWAFDMIRAYADDAGLTLIDSWDAAPADTEVA
jgi:hypothetical protein